jgi:hypothetical protein
MRPHQGGERGPHCPYFRSLLEVLLVEILRRVRDLRCHDFVLQDTKIPVLSSPRSQRKNKCEKKRYEYFPCRASICFHQNLTLFGHWIKYIQPFLLLPDEYASEALVSSIQTLNPNATRILGVNHLILEVGYKRTPKRQEGAIPRAQDGKKST